MNENTFNAKLGRNLRKKGLYAWKTHDTFENGIPDFFIEGDRQSVWIECKFLQALPKRPSTKINLTKPSKFLSMPQQEWLTRRGTRFDDAWVLLATPTVAGVFHTITDWETPFTAPEFLEKALPHKDIEQLIIDYCGIN